MAEVDAIVISIEQQRLYGFNRDRAVVFNKRVASAANGVGQQYGSECTPLGEHRVRAKIGSYHAENTVFVGRRPTGEIYSEKLAQSYPGRDWILTRILWLCGNEPGFNRGGQVDTQRRFIYIHGAPDSHAMGVASSHGCIKMRNSDIIELFDKVDVGTTVQIQEGAISVGTSISTSVGNVASK